MSMSAIQLAVLGRFTMTVCPTARPLVLSTSKVRAPAGTSFCVRLRVVFATVLRLPEPVTEMRLYCTAAVARRRVPEVAESPSPLSTTPLALMVSVEAT